MNESAVKRVFSKLLMAAVIGLGLYLFFRYLFLAVLPFAAAFVLCVLISKGHPVFMPKSASAARTCGISVHCAVFRRDARRYVAVGFQNSRRADGAVNRV